MNCIGESYLNIDRIDHRKLILLWILFISVIFSIYISTELFVPYEFKYLPIGDNLAHLTRWKFSENDTFTFQAENLTSVNQFLLTKLNPVPITEVESIDMDVDIEYSITNKKGKKLISKVVQIDNQIPTSPLVSRKDKTIYLPYVFNFKDKTLTVSLKLLDFDSIKSSVSELEVRLETNNEAFFNFILYLKTAFFLLSLYLAYLYATKYSLQLKPTRTTEQRLILHLSILLILYNFPVNFYLNTLDPFLPVLLCSSFINIAFYTYFMYFWIVIFQVI